MIDLWNSLPLIQQIYWCIALLSTLVTLIQALLTVVGLGADAVDVEVDVPDDPSGVALFSSQTIFAFLAGFGWSGLVCYSLGLPDLVTGMVSFFCGGGTMAAMYFFLVGLLSLQDRGNVEPTDAVGAVGQVYVRIPGSAADRSGQIQVIISGRMRTVDARTGSAISIPSGSQVRVVEYLGANCFLVEPLAPPASEPARGASQATA